MTKTTTIGVLGCANIAKRMVIPAIKQVEGLELVAIASRSGTKAEEFTRQFGGEPLGSYEELVERTDVDALYIPLPTGMHKEWLTKALLAGKHVICEKSLVENYEDAQEIVALAKEKNLLVMENFMFTYHSQHEFVFNLLNQGELGEIRSFRASFGFPPFPDGDNIRYQKSLGGGALLDAGGYPIKAAQLFLGTDLEVQGSSLFYDPEKGVDIYGGAFLKNKKGAFAEIAFGFDHYYQCNYEIWGSKGKLTAHRCFTAGPGFKPKVTFEKQDQYNEYILPADNHFVNILTEFCNSIQNNKSSNQAFTLKYDELLSQSRLLSQVRKHA